MEVETLTNYGTWSDTRHCLHPPGHPPETLSWLKCGWRALYTTVLVDILLIET